METALIKINSPYAGSELTLKWDRKKVSPAQNSKEAERQWRLFKSLSLYGKYGHIVDLSDTLLGDLVIAIESIPSLRGYVLNDAAKKQIELENMEEEKNPIPSGALS